MAKKRIKKLSDITAEEPKEDFLAMDDEDNPQTKAVDTGLKNTDDDEEIDLSEASGIPKEKQEDPEGEGDEDTIRKEILTNLPIAIRADAKWMEQAKEDINFCLGEQWDEQDKADLRAQKRPVMVFNKIKPLVQLVTGHLIQSKARIQAYPEGGEDEIFTGVMDKAIDHIEKVSHLNFKMSYLFSGGEKAGKNWIEFHVDYDEDPIFGQLKIPNLGPFKIFMDPQGCEYDLSDCGFGFKIQKLTKARLKQLYPDKEDEIKKDVDDALAQFTTSAQIVDAGDESDYGNDPTVSRGGLSDSDSGDELTGDQMAVTVVEYWKKKYVDRWFVYFVDDGSIEDFDSVDEANAEIARRQKMKHDKAMAGFGQSVRKIAGVRVMVDKIKQKTSTPPPVDDLGKFLQPPKLEDMKVQHAMRKRKVAKMQVAVMAGNVFMTKGMQDSPFEPYFSGFPFFRFISEWCPEAEKPELRFQGIVRSLKDPQREKNKSRSQFLHVLNTSANSGWIGDEDALTPAKWEELKQFGAVAGITIQKKKGSDLQRIHPMEPHMAQQVREKSANDDFKEVSGINSDLLAMQDSANPSGKAIALRIRQAVTILQPAFENFRYTKILIGQFLFSIIPTLFDSAKLEKVLGQKYMQDSGLDRPRLDAYLTMIHDGKYNVQINEAGAPDTIREETFEDLMQLAQAGVSMPPDLFIDYMNMSNKSEVMKRVLDWTKGQMAMAAQKGAPKQ
jgi:hypothetical protein